jgi:hypothetical protein
MQGCTTGHRASGKLFQQKHCCFGDAKVAGVWRQLRCCTTEACAAPSDVRALPPCRHLYSNSLSGTLPKEWIAMTSLTDL